MPRSSSGTPTTLAEINVTPLVDVMLVLLIVFMVSAPLMQQGAQVDLPKANTGTLNDSQQKLVLVVDRSARVLINGKVVPKGTLRGRLEAMSAGKPDFQIYLQADRQVAYGVIAQVIAEAKQAKIQRVGLVTLPSDLAGPAEERP